MRGKGSDFLASCSDLGITPAYAGKSGVIAGLGFSEWDHPRLCGEKIKNVKNRFARLGSPPPMRGKGRVSD